jgi:hypothetical protein
MHELLLKLGWTDTWCTILEIGLYAILIISSLIAIVKATMKIIARMIPKYRSIKCFKHKIKAIGVFYDWYVKAIKDGTISDEEIVEINQKFDDIINSCNSKVDCSVSKESCITSEDSKVVDTAALDSDGE